MSISRVGATLAAVVFLLASPAVRAQLVPVSDVAQIAIGSSHHCLVTTGGAAMCWGNNDHGQIGDGSNEQRGLPVPVSGLQAGVAKIAAGGGFSCALTNTGAVSCWGFNGYGSLGNGAVGGTKVPRPVHGLSTGVVDIAAGSGHACAVLDTGAVRCWGYNGQRQLGTGNTEDSGIPVDLPGVVDAIAVAAGLYHTCVIRNGGTAKCWGRNTYGALGDGSTSVRNGPVDVAGLTSIVSMALGDHHTCASTAGGWAWCWGSGYFRQLGNGETSTSAEPLRVELLGSAVGSVAAGPARSCAVVSGGIRCWGEGFGTPLGVGHGGAAELPSAVVGLAGAATAIVAGYNSTCAVLADGRAQCWGRGRISLGDNRTSLRPYPVRVRLASATDNFSAGGFGGEQGHSCAITGDARLWCWGSNERGQLGVGDVRDRVLPVASSGLAVGLSSVAVGSFHTCALGVDGGVRCWGDNRDGQLGRESSGGFSATPQIVSGLAGGVVQLAAGSLHSCIRTNLGAVRCWGEGWSGQLGNGGTWMRTRPVDVAGLQSGVTQIAAGNNHSCAILVGGLLKCWGGNESGELGNGSTTPSSIPVDVVGLDAPVLAVALSSGVGYVGASSTCALLDGGAVKCWGNNAYGQLGTGAAPPATTPVGVPGLEAGVVAIAAGAVHHCALLANGSVVCWGHGISGELGNGTLTYSPSPTPVLDLDDAVAIRAGANHSCALRAGGGLVCWGNDQRGQLGNGGRDFGAPGYVLQIDVDHVFKDAFEEGED